MGVEEPDCACSGGVLRHNAAGSAAARAAQLCVCARGEKSNEASSTQSEHFENKTNQIEPNKFGLKRV